MNMTPHETAMKIRRSFRTRMDGVVSHNMRSHGSEYRVNWGVSLMHLRDLANDFTPSYDVAIELWQDNVRESRIMALMLMPIEQFTFELAEEWIGELRNIEMAEMAALLLYSRLPFAAEIACQAITKPDDIAKVLGFNTLSRIANNSDLKGSDLIKTIDESLSSALNKDQTLSLSVRHAASNCLVRLLDCDILADDSKWHDMC